MSYRPSKTEDAHRGLALMAALACGLAACWYFFTTAFPFLWMSGLVRFPFLPPAPPKWQVITEVYGCLGLAILFGVFVTHLVFRVVNRWLNSAR